MAGQEGAFYMNFVLILYEFVKEREAPLMSKCIAPTGEALKGRKTTAFCIYAVKSRGYGQSLCMILQT